MDHFYRSIHGCFTFAEFYAYVAREASGDWHGVEVGALQGQSAAFFCVEQINAHGLDGRGLFDLVEREPSNCSLLETNVRHVLGGGAIYGVSSAAASQSYYNEQLNFVMLDAGHEYSDLRSDIDAWWPKVKPGGILATHDFRHYFPGLMRAWMETFPGFNVWPGSLWPEDYDARPDARADLVNRSALHKDTDYMPVAWVRK